MPAHDVVPRPGRALLLYLALLVLFITLAPMNWQWPTHIQFTGFTHWSDVLGNVLMFVPLGLLWQLSCRPQPMWLGVGMATLLGAGLSGLIELLQLLVPLRHSSALDVLTNAAGAALGAACYLLWVRYGSRDNLDARAAQLTALQMPLSQLLLLMLPLLWLHSSLSVHSPSRIWLISPVLLAAGVILLALWYHRLRPRGWHPMTACVMTVGWSLLALLPVAHVIWAKLLWLVPLTMVLSLAAIRWGRWGTVGRRFESVTLARVLPAWLLFMLLLCLWPVGPLAMPWRAQWGLQSLWSQPDSVVVLRWLEYVCTYTVFGYLLAQWQGRRPISQRQAAWQTLAIVIAIAVLMELLRGWHALYTASGLQACMAAVAGAWGHVLYRWQLDYIMRWRIFMSQQRSAIQTEHATVATTNGLVSPLS